MRNQNVNRIQEKRTVDIARGQCPGEKRSVGRPKKKMKILFLRKWIGP